MSRYCTRMAVTKLPNRTGQRPTFPGAPPSVASSWERQTFPMRILRAFLGVTFTYAGVQKFMDHNFLHAGTPDYIGDQLKGFAAGSPIAPLLHVVGHAPVLTGIGIALVEIAVGLGTLLGIAPMVWAACGGAINLILFLSATWHVHPYFLGSDSMYAVAWGAYLAGLIEAERARARTEPPLSRRERVLVEQDLSRRRFLRGAVIAAGAFALGIAGSLLSSGPSEASGAVASPTAPRTSKPHASKGTGGGTGGGAGEPPTAGTPIASLDSIPVGGAVAFNDPAQGPAVLCRLSQNNVAAYSRVCTHAGCLVEFDRGSGVLFCPCHGAEFDPSHGAEVIGGPAPTPLASVPVSIDRATGQVVATD
jgi:thiosulfate dehydrogenase [quinone] large subunit